MNRNSFKFHLSSSLLILDYIRHRVMKPIKAAGSFVHDAWMSVLFGGRPGYIYFDGLEDYNLEADGILICRGNAVSHGAVYYVPFHISNRFLLRGGLNQYTTDLVMTQAYLRGHRPIYIEKDRQLYTSVGQPIPYEKWPSFLHHRPLRTD